MKVQLFVHHTEYPDDQNLSVRTLDTETPLGPKGGLTAVYNYFDYIVDHMQQLGELAYVQLVNVETKEILRQVINEPAWWNFENFQTECEFEVGDTEGTSETVKWIIDACASEVITFKYAYLAWVDELYDFYAR